MTTICKADKNRLTVRGVQDGERYLVKQQVGGWWIEPAPAGHQRVRELTAPKRDLAEHLDALAGAGFSFDPQPKEAAPKCRF